MNITPEQKTLLDYMAKGLEYQSQVFKELNRLEFFFIIKDKGHFSPDNNPRPIESEKDKGFFTIPYWPVLSYLERVSRECIKAENVEYAKALMEIIRDVTRPQGDRTKRTDNYHTWQFFVKIMANLPLDIVKVEDIELIADWLESKFDTSIVVLEISKTLLPKLLQLKGVDLEKVTRIFEIIVNSVKVERRHSMSAHSLQEIFKLNAAGLGQKCGENIARLLKSKIEVVVTEKDNNYCYMWRPAIEDHEQNVGSDEYRHILVAGMRDIFLSYASSNDASIFIELCLNSEKFIVRRISIYVLDKLFSKYQSLAEKIIIEKSDDLFLESNYHHEWYLFIVRHFCQLSNGIPEKLIGIISKLTGNWREDADRERLDAMMRRRWLYAIKSSGYSISQVLEEKYFKGIDYKPEHPEFLSYIGPVSWGEESLFSAMELLAKGDISNIVSFLNSYEGKNQFGESAIREAGQSLKEAIKAKQSFFELDLDSFLECKWEYWYYIFQAFEELWQDKKQINWDKILSFASRITEEKDNILWEKEADEKRSPLHPRRSWIPAVIADIINKGVHNDEWSMPAEYLPNAERILRILMDKQESSASGDDKDALTEAINTTKGRVIESFINYVLRKYRIYEKLPDKGKNEREEFWKTSEKLFDEEINRTKKGNFEFSSLAGAYLPNLYYLSEGWVRRHINDIFPQEEKHWRCAMQGYSYVNTVYATIYNLLRDNGHLKKAIDTDFANDQIKRRIIENIAISYLRGQETIEGQDSLFKYILERMQIDDIEEIISLFWAHRDAELTIEQREHIFNFWRYCFTHIKGQEESRKTILSDMNLLAVFFTELTGEQRDWLVQSAPYVEERYHSAFFLEYLDKIADKSAKEVGEVFLVMLKKAVPWYKEENIRSIVEKLFKACLKNDFANPICDIYARAGFEFLTDIYKKYNS